MSYDRTDDLQKQIDDINERLDRLTGEKVRREAAEVRERADLSRDDVNREQNARWLKQTADGWILVKRDDNSEEVPLPSHLKVSLTSSASGRDRITVLESIWTGLKANVAIGFLVAANPHHGAVTMEFGPRQGGPIDIGGETYDKQVVLTFTKDGQAKKVGPHPAKTHPTNPTPEGTHVMQIPDYPHAANPSYGPLRTVWFRVGTSGDRYIHPGRISNGCITCAPGNWGEIYAALVMGRKDSTAVGDVKVKP